MKCQRRCINDGNFINKLIHIITKSRRERNDGNVMGAADYAGKEDLRTGSAASEGPSQGDPYGFGDDGACDGVGKEREDSI